MRKVLAIIVVLAVAGVGIYTFREQSTSHSAGDTKSKTTDGGFDATRHSIDDADSIWLVVNKQRPLGPRTYTPQPLTVPDMPLRLDADTPEMQLREDAARALAAMARAGKNQGIELMLSSGYRSYTYQDNLYTFYVNKQGQAEADTQSARPGYSEHQTGLAADVEPVSRECEVQECFGDLAEGKWVAANAYKYGFIIRYQKDMDGTTGYTYEPWHLRYVGTELAAELHARGNPTLETYFKLPKAPDY